MSVFFFFRRKQEKVKWKIPSTTVQNNVIAANIERKLNVFLNVIGAELEANGDAATRLAHLLCHGLEVRHAVHAREGGWRDGVFAGRQIAHLGDLWRHLIGRQVPARACLRALPALEVERLHFLYVLNIPTEFGRRQFIEIL